MHFINFMREVKALDKLNKGEEVNYDELFGTDDWSDWQEPTGVTREFTGWHPFEEWAPSVEQDRLLGKFNSRLEGHGLKVHIQGDAQNVGLSFCAAGIDINLGFSKENWGADQIMELEQHALDIFNLLNKDE